MSTIGLYDMLSLPSNYNALQVNRFIFIAIYCCEFIFMGILSQETLRSYGAMVKVFIQQ